MYFSLRRNDSKANVTAFVCLQNGGNVGVEKKLTICHCRLAVLFMTLLFFLLSFFFLV